MKCHLTVCSRDLEKLTGYSLSFKVQKVSLPCLQEPATFVYAKADETIPHLSIPYLRILQFMLGQQMSQTMDST
jgi:hypothetical protein